MTAWLESAAQRQPGAPALACDSIRVDYAELADQASRRAATLAGLGLRTGDRVMLEAPVTLDVALWLHALLWMGATVIPIAPSLPPGDASTLLFRLKPRALITSNSAAGSNPGATPSDCESLIVIDAATEPGIASVPPAAHDPDRLATIMLTSGSSSAPKAVPLTLGNHAASAGAVAERIGTEPADRWLLCLPLEHVGGLAILFRSVMLGHAVVLMERFNAAEFIERIDDQRITLASVVPRMLDAILSVGHRPPSAGLRGVFVGGAPAAPALLERARDAGWPVLPTWGMTEACSQLATPAPSAAADMDFASVALPPLPGVEVRTAPTGALQVRGRMLFSGYLDDALAAPDSDGWFTTGDQGIVEPDGAVRISGRIDDVIISGGINVGLDAVAQRLLGCPLIDDVAVVAIVDPRWGQRVAAAVVVEKNECGLSEALAAWSRRHLAPAERPARWHIVDRIPRSSAGKPLTPAIKALFE